MWVPGFEYLSSRSSRGNRWWRGSIRIGRGGRSIRRRIKRRGRRKERRERREGIVKIREWYDGSRILVEFSFNDQVTYIWPFVIVMVVIGIGLIISILIFVWELFWYPCSSDFCAGAGSIQKRFKFCDKESEVFVSSENVIVNIILLHWRTILWRRVLCVAFALLSTLGVI